MPRKTITIYDGDDFERLAEAHAAVGRAERALEAVEDKAASKSARYGDGEGELVEAREAVKVAKDAYDELVDAAAERADAWVVESIGHEAWRGLLKAHPPRKVTKDPAPPLPGETAVAAAEQVDHPDDVYYGVDTEKFGKALLTFVDPDDDEHRTITAIGDAVPTDLAKRLRRLSAGQFDTLWIVAYQLNVGGVADPKAVRFSTVTRSTES